MLKTKNRSVLLYTLMASLFLAFFLLLPSLASPATNPIKPTIINPNERIFATTGPTAWYSPSRRLAFGFFPLGDGFLVGTWIVGDTKTGNVMVWTANRDRPQASSNAAVVLTASGKLVLTDGDVELNVAEAPERVAYASLHDSGNFVLHGENSNSVWESFHFPTDTILGGQRLRAGGQLFSKESPSNFSTGKFHLDMQSNGNLVAYPSNTNSGSVDACWETGVSTYRILYLDDVGRLKLEAEFNSRLFKQLNGNYSGDNTLQTIYRATLDPNGYFSVYANTSTDPLWTAMNGTCVIKNACGFNSYRTLNDSQQTCLCMPGTEQVSNGGQNSFTCQRNSTKQKCRDGRADVALYSIATMKNLKWDDASYFNVLMTEENCKKSCLEDCNCDAAVYDSNNFCRKHRFPLWNASRDPVINSTSFFKVGTESVVIDSNGNTIVLPERVVVSDKKTWVLILVLTLSLVTYSCIALAISGLFLFKTRMVEYRRLVELNGSSELTLRLYSYDELRKVTKGFKEELGKGSFGAVYKGTVQNGEKIVAVKRLEKLVEEGEPEFISEMRVIGKTHHKNLVKLLGYCVEGSNRLLVYEYMSNSTLADLLFRSERRPDWHERVRVALDVARGILYLHEECESPIIHCDVKPQNILMDEFWTAKISDFGLAKLLMPDQTRTHTRIRGTRGYVAPEWEKNLPITLKVDVYSFGIVLLEIICCRRNIDVSVSRPEEVLLSGWAYRCFAQGELGMLVGNEQVDMKSLERMIAVALWCIQADPARRPSMKGVVLMLEGFTTISAPPCPTD